MGRLVFPTRRPLLARSYPSRETATIDSSEFSSEEMVILSADPRSGAIPGGSQAESIHANIIGIHQQPTPMSREEMEALGDRFSRDLFLKGRVPFTLREILDEIGALTGDASLPIRRLFLVAEGGQHIDSHPDFPLNARLVFVWRRSLSSIPELMLSTVPFLDDDRSLMQLIAWSEVDKSFHFFERLKPIWAWAGNGYHAFDSRSRGKGPFDSHINGGLVMKELKFPWAHWQSQSNSIPLSLLEDSDFGDHSALSEINGAEELEKIVTSGLRHWTESRLLIDKNNDEVGDPIGYLRQVLTPTSVNLVSTSTPYSSSLGDELRLPQSFFADVDAFRFLGRRLNWERSVVPNVSVRAAGSDYVAAIKNLDIGVQADENGPRILGDTHFCFLVPERAFEDFVVIQKLVGQNLISARLAMCMLLVDFPNPLESSRREVILNHVSNMALPFGELTIDEAILPSVEAAAQNGSSPETELMSYWTEPDLFRRCEIELASFFGNIQSLANTPEGVVSLLTIAESRRNRFRRRKLSEFSATLAMSSKSIGNWIMTKSGEIVMSDAHD